METIKRKINIKDFVEKFGENEPCIDKNDYSGSSYGFIPYNIVIGYDFPLVFHNMPNYFTLSGDTAVKYHTFAKYYVWLRRFIMESKYYVPGRRRNDGFWTETGSTLNYKEGDKGKYYLFSISESVLSGLPSDISGYTCAESIICVNESADTFFDLYNSIEDAVEFLDFSEEMIFNGEYEVDSPFVEIPLLLEEEISDLGGEEMYWPEELKIDKDGKYISPLYKADEDCDYVKGDYVLIDGSIYKATENIPIGSYYSDSHWELCETSDKTGDTATTYFVESKLRTLKRQKTFSDDSGNTYDFVFNFQTEKCELPFRAENACNCVFDEKIGCYKYDIISSIVCEKENGETIDYNSLTDDDLYTKGKIKFVYVIGNLLSGDTSAEICTDDSAGGIEYEEVLDFEVSSVTFTTGGLEYTRPYLYVDYNSGEKASVSESDGDKYAKIVIKNTEESEIFANTLIRNDKAVGLTEWSFNVGKINVDRGTSSSYEAFSVIGEVNSLDDIENYHNDWFKIVGKND